MVAWMDYESVALMVEVMAMRLADGWVVKRDNEMVGK